MAQKALHETTGLADSPCIGICTVTQWGTRTCKGCGRTASEIRDWNTFEDVEKKLIVLRCWEDYLPRQKREALQLHKNKS
jgi:predicted Fe-S protein YdhL (DUF1289 family)|tara:strand:+ start:2128 stop:2367 length:240 start_codon:yes stop_codon:yes gene_type:complete